MPRRDVICISIVQFGSPLAARPGRPGPLNQPFRRRLRRPRLPVLALLTGPRSIFLHSPCSQKEEKPTLAGVRLKTRKRNIVVPHDPLSFANTVVDLLYDAYTTEYDSDVDTLLSNASKIIDTTELDFSRYGEVLFEVAFAGKMFATEQGKESEGGKSLPFCILKCASRDEIIPYIRWFQSMIRRRPFLVKALELTMIKLILSLEFYGDAEKKNVAIGMSRCFALKVGVLPDRVLPNALEDRLVARGTIASFITDLFVDFLATETVESLVELLRKAKVQDKLLDFFPQQERTWEMFNKHFVEAGLSDFVEYNQKKLHDANIQELKFLIKEMTCGEEGPYKPAEILAAVKEKIEECNFEQLEVLKCCYLGIVEGTLDTAGSKNTQQTQYAVLKNLKYYRKLLLEFCTSGRQEAALMVTIQVTCYEDSRLLKLFADIVKILYDCDVLGEAAIKYWYAKPTVKVGRNVFENALKPLVEWLDEAEEEDSDEE